MGRSLALLVDPGVQRLFDGFSRLFGIRIALFDTAWNEVRVGAARAPSCAYCRHLRGALGRESACIAEDRRRRLEAARSGRMVAYRCHAGLDEALLPVQRDGQIVGWIMIGQFRTAAAPPARVLRAPWARGHAAALRRHWRAVPCQPAARRGDVLAFFSMLVETVTGRELVQARQDPLVAELLTAAQGRTLTLAEASRRSGLGRTVLAQRLKASLGCGLRQAQIAARLERAERLIAGGASVTEAARTVGYDDPLYFSRLYKRHRGHAPSQHR